MNTLSMELLKTLGEEKSRRLYMNFDAGIYENYTHGKDDNSHLRPDGAYEFSKLAASQIIKIADDFPSYTELSDELLIGKENSLCELDQEIDDEFLVFKK